MAKKKLQSEEMLVPEEEVAAPAYEVDEEPEGQLSPIEALVGVIIRPKSTFERMRDAAVGHWWVVAVLAVLALTLMTIAQAPLQAAGAAGSSQVQMESTNTTRELSEEEQAQVEQAQEQMQELMSSQALWGAILGCFGVIGLAISYLVRAGIVFLLGLALGGRASFKQVWRMAVWTTLPDVLRTIVSAVVVLVTGSQSASGLSYVLTSAEVTAYPYLATFLGAVDIYVVWSLALLGIGLCVTSQLNRGKSAAVALTYWLLTLLFSFGLIALNQALLSTMGMG